MKYPKNDFFRKVYGIVYLRFGNCRQSKKRVKLTMATTYQLATIYEEDNEDTMRDLMDKTQTLNLEDSHPVDNLSDTGLGNQRVQENITAEVPAKFRYLAPNMLHVRKQTGTWGDNMYVLFETAIVAVRLDRRPSGWCPELGDTPVHPVHALVITEDAQTTGQCFLNIYDVTNERPVIMHHPVTGLGYHELPDLTGLHYVTDHMVELTAPGLSMCINLPWF